MVYNLFQLIRLFALAIIWLCLIAGVAFAQTADNGGLSTPIAVEAGRAGDADIRQRLVAIFSEIDELRDLQPTVREGVVVLSGSVPNETAAERALSLTERLEGIVAVEDNIDRTLSVEDNLNPLLERYQATLEGLARAWPLYAVALTAFVLVALLGYAVASASALWATVAPNPFIARLIVQTIRIAGILLGLLLALSILDAMALFGAAAGSAGLIGLAVGFAVRDTIENYIASVMLSLRQPFRANDHVVIDNHEGIVVRLTSRATILMTLEGNHLRIPNAQVFKGIILNYTRNPQRRLEFELGVDADDDPLAAMEAGDLALKKLPFILTDPQPLAGIKEVGDSSIVIWFAAWVDQRDANFLKARSGAINAVKQVLEEQGFTLPEPIYRLRIDGMDLANLATSQVRQKASQKPAPQPRSMDAADIDVTPELDVQKQVEKERAQGDQEDLLNDARPVE
ncbi:MAG: mechanosensitive ion channel family protein [Hyphomicrobiales bacterium]|jgi:small conductance mechanosensitive channel